MNIIKQGSLFLLTKGDYSDYTIVAVCKAKEDIDIQKLKKEYSSGFDKKKDSSLDLDNFVKWLLVDKDIGEEIECFEWELGSDWWSEFLK